MTRRAWRSPSRLPRPADPTAFRAPERPVQRLLVGGAWRARAFAAALGHGLKRAPDAAAAERVLARASGVAHAATAFASAAARHGVADVEALVACRLAGEPWPWPESWSELALADALVGTAATAALRALTGSADEAVAQAAAAWDPRSEAFGAAALDALDLGPGAEECLQILVDRWAPTALQVLGPPDAAGEPDLLGDRTKEVSAAGSLREVLGELRAFLRPRQLALPGADRMGLRLPGPA